MNGHSLIIGGASSGKSLYAERLALAACAAPVYIATSQAWDDEMAARIARHRARRDSRWTTIEEPLELERALKRADAPGTVILVDCLTLWVSNLMADHDDESMARRFGGLADMLCGLRGAVYFVSNEVGLGIVPDNPMSRRFRDLSGSLHQTLGAVCANVLFVAAGLPLALKGAPPVTLESPQPCKD